MHLPTTTPDHQTQMAEQPPWISSVGGRLEVKQKRSMRLLVALLRNTATSKLKTPQLLVVRVQTHRPCCLPVCKAGTRRVFSRHKVEQTSCVGKKLAIWLT